MPKAWTRALHALGTRPCALHILGVIPCALPLCPKKTNLNCHHTLLSLDVRLRTLPLHPKQTCLNCPDAQGTRPFTLCTLGTRPRTLHALGARLHALNEPPRETFTIWYFFIDWSQGLDPMKIYSSDVPCIICRSGCRDNEVMRLWCSLYQIYLRCHNIIFVTGHN